jgi:hypothetical protein
LKRSYSDGIVNVKRVSFGDDETVNEPSCAFAI